jgi:MoaA/NifB/PqqE/SkfB family radical SAM enzyme
MQYARQLARDGVDSVDISLCGSTVAMHEYHSQVPRSFRQTIAGISNAASAGMIVGVSVIVTRSNFRDLAGIVRLAGKLGAGSVQLRQPIASGRANAIMPRLQTDSSIAAQYIAQAVQVAVEMSVAFQFEENHPTAASRALVDFAGTERQLEACLAAAQLQFGSVG